jgi:hypothetical protein
MRRRDFINLIAGLAAASPLAALQTDNMWPYGARRASGALV